MLPSFSNGDKILIDKNFGTLERGDVIAFLYPKDKSKWYFKRVIGLPGENVEIREGKVFISNQVLNEPYIDESYNQTKMSLSPCS
jgi:signal peptidase I